MDSNLYQTLKTKVISGIPISKVTSWAIWDKEKFWKKNQEPDAKYHQDLLQKIESQIDKLNTKIVFVGLNWGTEFKVTDKEGWVKIPDWGNFHNSFWSYGGDRRIKEVLEGTRFEGTYMTDLFKNMATKNANDLKAKIKAGIITENDIAEQIKIFIEEIDSLETEQIEMYLFGEDVEKYFKKYIIGKDYQRRLMKRVKLCQRITHFAPAATYFPEWAPVQLDLKENNIGATIYKPLWC